MISYVLPDRALGALPREKPYGKAGGKSVAFTAPRDQWAARAGLGRKIIKLHCGPIKRQRFSDCTCGATTNAVETTRSQMGLPHVELSPTAIYNHINGGYDRGSRLQDAANYVTQVGCVPVSMWPADVWRMREPAGYRETAARLRVLEWIDVPDGAGVVTAIGWYGKPVAIGVPWGAIGHAIVAVNYDLRAAVPKEHLDAYAELVKHYERVNPALADLCGAALDGDEIWFEIENSWGAEYGENGFGWLPWSQVNVGVRDRHGGICMASVTFTEKP